MTRPLTPGVLRALSSWMHMLQRCFDPCNAGFVNYGARGISVCERWMDPWSFLNDLGERPEGLSLGRIDNDGGYEPSNCRWETDLQQNSNTRRTVLIDGVTQSATARFLGLSDATVMRRRRAGLPLGNPPHFKRNKLTRDQVALIKTRIAQPTMAPHHQWICGHTGPRTGGQVRGALMYRCAKCVQARVDSRQGAAA